MPAYFTRSGDDGHTGLLGEGRVPKYHPRPEAFGTVDEASAALGLARALARSAEGAAVTAEAQRDLYHIMAELAATSDQAERFRSLRAERVAWLERWVEQLGAQVEMPREFVIAGDSHAGAAYALARTIVRRAERGVARLAHEGLVGNPEVLRYLNRLSSLCFVLELLEDRLGGAERPSLAKTDGE